MRVSRPSNAPSWARRRRHENGKVSTHWRSPLFGGSNIARTMLMLPTWAYSRSKGGCT
jgi:hypothetical protein